MIGRLPNFLVIGAAKSGTTALWSLLRQHPQVFMPALKEPHHFAFDADQPAPQFRGPGANLHRDAVTGTDAYRALFADAGEALAVGEASATYLYVAASVERIRAAIPDARLVAILRQPADRAYSSYLHLKRQGREPAP
ncbi:MAG TPA: sulfotransferase, partial [Candidatus Limnocylindria bacterium]